MRQHLIAFVGFFLAGAALGGTIASLVGPGFITWYTTPGGSTPAMCECASLVQTTISAFLRIQIWGAVIGALIATPSGMLARRAAMRRKGEAPPAQA